MPTSVFRSSSREEGRSPSRYKILTRWDFDERSEEALAWEVMAKTTEMRSYSAWNLSPAEG